MLRCLVPRTHLPGGAVPHLTPMHILDAKQFSPNWLTDTLFPLADTMRSIHQLGDSRVLNGKRLFYLFYQPSTRTRLSFESAMTLLGGTVSGLEPSRDERDDETLEDRIRVLNCYDYDAILLRHHEEGGAARAAGVSSAPVINAGDGSGEHPTQALLDAYTILREVGRLEDIEVAFVGDLTHERTVNSLALILSRFPKVRFRFVSPPTLRIRPELRELLEASSATFDEGTDMNSVAGSTDVVYITRAHTDRMAMAQRFDTGTGTYRVDASFLAALQAQAVVLHPLPRGPELDPALDSDPRIACFRQAANGLFVRMALLTLLVSENH
jgi:aspartate carbamoyltransferase catalytic subunit